MVILMLWIRVESRILEGILLKTKKNNPDKPDAFPHVLEASPVAWIPSWM
jgi:hypothetical protein